MGGRDSRVSEPGALSWEGSAAGPVVAPRESILRGMSFRGGARGRHSYFATKDTKGNRFCMGTAGGIRNSPKIHGTVFVCFQLRFGHPP